MQISTVWYWSFSNISDYYFYSIYPQSFFGGVFYYLYLSICCFSLLINIGLLLLILFLIDPITISFFFLRLHDAVLLDAVVWCWSFLIYYVSISLLYFLLTVYNFSSFISFWFLLLLIATYWSLLWYCSASIDASK